MADNNSPWGRKSTGGGMQGGGNSGGGGKGPGNPFEKIIRDSKDKMRHALPKSGDGNPRDLIIVAFAVLALLWLGSGIYRVNSDELGIVMRFGQYTRTALPGLNYHLPAPIESVMIPSVTTVNTVEIGRRSGNAENPSVRVARLTLGDRSKNHIVPQSEGLMLTGDRNIVDIDFTVQWKIDATNPEKFLFNMRNPAGNVRIVAESAMREVIGRTRLDDVLTGAQSQIAEDTKTLIQQMFDEYDAGIEVIAVNLSRPDVPQPVIDEFQDVKRAEQDKQTAESVAEGYRNEIIPRAKGEAAKMLQDAEAYKAKVVADAQGNASRFKQIYAEYAQAKEVTKRRMYLETMEEVLKGMPKLVMENGKGGALPVLPITLSAPKAPAAAAGVTPATPATAAPTPR
ncbi:MAG: FtsH protease activity modulator HflK [Alphaproteobacteria bacterium]|nr:FtsH protease activity modulator HflK [Alphaproteobacteria bacterium]